MSIKTRKVGIIGAGNVGSHVGLQLAVQGLADEIVFYDTNHNKAVGESLDLLDAVSYQPHHVDVYADTIDAMKDADIIVHATGRPRLPDQTRLDMLEGGIATTKEWLPMLEKSGFDGIIISISNPCDIVAAYIQRALDYPKHKIIGSGTALDSARFQMQLSTQLQINRRSLTAYMLGEHGDSSMIPWSHVTVAGKKLDELLMEKPDLYTMIDKADILEKVHREGYVENTTKGCTEFGVSSATAELIRAIYHNEHKVLPLSVYLDGPYGVHDCFASVPVKVGKDGVEDIIELHLTAEEMTEFQKSIIVLKEHFQKALKV